MFSDRSIRALKPSATRYTQMEDKSYGAGTLGVRVSPNGAKTFIWRGKMGAKDKLVTLGKYPDLSLAEARKRAAELAETRGNVRPEEKPQTMTVAALAELYMEKWSKPNKKSWKVDRRILTTQIVPHIGEMLVHDVRRPHIRSVVEHKQFEGHPVAARMSLAIMSKMFNFALQRDLLEGGSPAALVEMPRKNAPKSRVLSHREIQQFWNELTNPNERQKLDVTTAMALRMVLLTAARPGEVAGMQWFEIDGDWWNLPEDRSKNGIAHRVPLSGAAMEILDQMKELCCGKLVFPSVRYITSRGASQMNPSTMGAALARAKVGYTPHDLRRTAATMMASIGVDPMTISRLLNHKQGGVTWIYNRYSYDREKRQALDTWSSHLLSIIQS